MKTITLITPPPHKYDLTRCIRAAFARPLFSSLLLLSLLGFNAPTFAQAEQGVSTISKTNTAAGLIIGFSSIFQQHANAFITGANGKGYELTQVSFNLDSRQGNPGQLQVAIHEDDNGDPGTMLPGAMIKDDFEGSMAHTVDFPAQIVLQPSTTYFIVFSSPDSPAINVYGSRIRLAGSGVDITGTDNSWSIATGTSAGRSTLGSEIWTTTGNRLAFGITARVGALFPPSLTDQTFIMGQENTLILPVAIGGVGMLTYTLTGPGGADLPEGLSFADDGTRILSGTPTMLGDTELTYTSSDDENDDVVTTFTLTVVPPSSSNNEEVIVSEVARAIVSATVSAVTSRISNVASGVAGVNVGGLSLNDANRASALQNNAQALAGNSDAMKTLLGNSDFSLPLNAVGDGGGFGSVGIWASGEYSDLSGKSDELDWDGELTGFHLGIDGKIRTSGDKNILIGLAVSSLNGDLDYENETAAGGTDKGNYEIDMTTVSPYIGWRAGVVDLWASVGFGEGEVELTDDAMPNTTHKSDAEQTSFAIGGSVADMVVNKNYSVKLKGELSASEFDIDESEEGRITEQTVDATRARISVEASRISDLENGRAFEKSAEIGARFDGGDGETGAGVEVGGKLKYHAANGFTAEGSARVLLGHSGDYQEWGIQGTVRKQIGRDGQGLSFHLTPAYGDVNSGVQQLLAQGLSDSANNDANNTADPDYEMHMTTRLGYGIAYRGMVTPYTEMVLGTTNQYRMGINWKPNQTFNLTLLGEQAQQNAIRLQGAINF